MIEEWKSAIKEYIEVSAQLKKSKKNLKALKKIYTICYDADLQVFRNDKKDIIIRGFLY